MAHHEHAMTFGRDERAIAICGPIAPRHFFDRRSPARDHENWLLDSCQRIEQERR